MTREIFPPRYIVIDFYRITCEILTIWCWQVITLQPISGEDVNLVFWFFSLRACTL